MRPQLRLLRHPLVPRQAAVALHAARSSTEVDAARRAGGHPRRGGAGGPGPRRRSHCDRSGGRTEPRLDGPAVGGNRPIVDLVAAVSARVRWTRLLYLYPSTLDDALVEAILATGVPYFDLSLQHVSRPLLKRMRRWGEGDRFLERIALDPGRRADGGLPLVVHRRLPGGDRGGPRPAAGLDRGGPARLGRVLPLQQRGGHLRRRPRRPGARRARAPSGSASAPSCRTPSRPRRREDLIGTDASRCWSTRRARPAPTARPRRSTAS